MPRQARIDAPAVLHHIIILGIERKYTGIRKIEIIRYGVKP